MPNFITIVFNKIK